MISMKFLEGLGLGTRYNRFYSRRSF